MWQNAKRSEEIWKKGSKYLCEYFIRNSGSFYKSYKSNIGIFTTETNN